LSAFRNRLPAQIAGLIAAVLLLALWLFRSTVYEAPPRPPEPAAAAAPSPRSGLMQARVVSVRGEVERGRAGGEWSAVQPGQTVQPDELLRTGAHGATDLTIGERSRVSIGESTELSIRELTDSVHRFRLTRGRMVADYDRDGQRLLRVEDGQGEAVAETRAARFSVLSTGTGIAVATSAGAVDLSARHRTVHVSEGQQSFVAPGAPPARPSPVPTAVLLKVANALAGESASVCAEIDGNASPGSEVTVDDVPVPLGAEGRFNRQVLRMPGKRAVRVLIRDAAGHQKARTVPCSPTPAEIDDMAIRWKQAP
jgi:hypothetical protein